MKVKGLKFKEIACSLDYYRFQILDLLPKEFQEQFKEESYIGGGSIYTMFHYDYFNDVDIFIRTEDLKNKLMNYFKSISNNIGLFQGAQFWKGNIKDKRFILTKNALSIDNIQIVIKDIGDPYDVIGKFDFEHNMFFIENEEVITSTNLSAFYNKYLKYNQNRARDIVGVIIRTQKYLNRGMTMDTQELAKMLLDLNKVGFSDEELKMLNSEITSQSFSS